MRLIACIYNIYTNILRLYIIYIHTILHTHYYPSMSILYLGLVTSLPKPGSALKPLDSCGLASPARWSPIWGGGDLHCSRPMRARPGFMRVFANPQDRAKILEMTCAIATLCQITGIKELSKQGTRSVCGSFRPLKISENQWHNMAHIFQSVGCLLC